MTRKETVSFQAPADLIKRWKMDAESRGLSFSDYVRCKLAGRRLPAPMRPYPVELVKELASLGNLMNEIADAIHGNSKDQSHLDNYLESAAEILASMRRKL
jgi:hypothetical protein